MTLLVYCTIMLDKWPNRAVFSLIGTALEGTLKWRHLRQLPDYVRLKMPLSKMAPKVTFSLAKVCTHFALDDK